MYTLPDLPYEYDALGAHISADIMKLHHGKHHQAYVDKLNEALDSHEGLKRHTLTELVSNIQTLPEDVRTAIRNHGGGHYNHSLFWEIMSPNGGGQPGGELATLIANKYGSFQAFHEAFSAEATGVFGSGWVWLQPNGEIMTTQNQDTPMLSGGEEPLMGLDVWEHAYYLDYKNSRPDYIAAWWNVVDWDAVAQRYSKLH